MDGGAGYQFYDLTSSGLNQAAKSWRPLEVNRHRVATMNWGDNFGLVTIDSTIRPAKIVLQIRGVDGDVFLAQKLNLATNATIVGTKMRRVTHWFDGRRSVN